MRVRSGFLIFYSPGSLEQIVLSQFLCVICIAVYNNCKPYEINSNDWLQQLCQFSIFVTLLSALVLQVDVDKRSSSAISGFLFAATLIPPILVIPMTAIEEHRERPEMFRKCVHIVKGLSPGGLRKGPALADQGDVSATGDGFSPMGYYFRNLSNTLSSVNLRNRPPRAKIEDDEGDFPGPGSTAPPPTREPTGQAKV